MFNYMRDEGWEGEFAQPEIRKDVVILQHETYRIYGINQ